MLKFQSLLNVSDLLLDHLLSVLLPPLEWKPCGGSGLVCSSRCCISSTAEDAGHPADCQVTKWVGGGVEGQVGR
jgi:hypothetical protein